MHYWNSVLNEVLNKDENTRAFLFTNQGRLDEEMDFYAPSRYSDLKETRDLRAYYLGEKYPGLYLTKREAESVFWLVQGCTIAQAALHMGLSARTVEYYIKNLKAKLCCKTKKELLSKVLYTTLLQQLEKDGMKIVRH